MSAIAFAIASCGGSTKTRGIDVEELGRAARLARGKQPRECGRRDREGNVEMIDVPHEHGQRVSGRWGETADAMAASDVEQRACGRQWIVPMRCVRDRMSAERKHETDEQGPRPVP